MEENPLQDLKPFEQKPYWEPDAQFVLSGVEFERVFVTLTIYVCCFYFPRYYG